MTGVCIYDTTLRDGAQGEGISFTVEDKLKIARHLDRLGVAFIEGGWPGSNPKDSAFFQRMRVEPLQRAQLVAFGSTRRPGTIAAAEAQLQALVDAGTSHVTVFGKSWDLQVTDALHTTLAENLAMVGDTIRWLKQQGKQVIYDAEHFFDGYRSNADYAVQTLEEAVAAGADWVVLCDTNGGTLPTQVQALVRLLLNKLPVPLGVHCHNDSELAVANSLAAVRVGVRQLQGTINGLGERCGNANLCSIIPNLELKLGIPCLPPGNLQLLTSVARTVAEIGNRSLPGSMPFIGASAFAHKGGIHVSAVAKNPLTYEHIAPEVVGNHRRVLVSEMAGTSTLVYKARELGLSLEEPAKLAALTTAIKDMEHAGYQFEGAEASMELLLRRTLDNWRPPFDVESFRVAVDRQIGGTMVCDAVIKLRVGERSVYTAAEGNGPVNALDNALRKALEEFYPFLSEMVLTDYKVRVLDGADGTSSNVRVLIESRCGGNSWTTLGVSANIIEASWQALVDSMAYALLQEEREVRSQESGIRIPNTEYRRQNKRQ